MHVRHNINAFLRRSRYQIIKVGDGAKSDDVPPEILLDDQILGSRILAGRKHAWIIAAPKSGSTWLSAILGHLLGWRSVDLTGGSYLRREQEPDVRQIVRFPRENIFSPHQHCRASESTVDFIKQFRIKPVIQVRNVYDSVISFREHCVNDGLFFPMAYIDDKFLTYPEEKQLQFVIDLVLPWYFNFYASWFQVAGLSRDDLLFVNYDELRADTLGVITRILNYLGETRTAAEVEASLGQAGRMNTLKNKAVPGRGRQLLTERHKDRIKELAGYYSHIDFSMVGL